MAEILTRERFKKTAQLAEDELRPCRIAVERPELAREIGSSEPRSSVEVLAGVLLDPRSGGTLRIESLIQMTLAYGHGDQRLRSGRVNQWVNRYLRKSAPWYSEDPAEDVHTGNVMTDIGDRLVLQGNWQHPDLWLQFLMDAVRTRPEFVGALKSVDALLRLSDAMLRRAGLARNTHGETAPRTDVPVPANRDLERQANLVRFSEAALKGLGIKMDDLATFILGEEEWGDLADQVVGASAVDRRPLILDRGDVIFALPTAVTVAARLFLLESAVEHEESWGAFTDALLRHQIELVQRAARSCGVSPETAAFALPPTPPFPAIRLLGRLDARRLVDITLMVTPSRPTADLFCGYPEFNDSESRQLDAFLMEGRRELSRSYPGQEIRTLLIVGGVGTGLSFGTDSELTVLTLAEFWMMSNQDRALFDSLDRIDQEERALQRIGVQVAGLSESTRYGFWQSNNFKLLPRAVPAAWTTELQVPIDAMAGFSFRWRDVCDLHASETVHGALIRVRRHDPRQDYRKGARRPIYGAEPGDAPAFTGLVERLNGRIWVVADWNPEPTIGRFCFDLWEAVLFWLDWLISELGWDERVNGVHEIRLQCDVNFEALDVEDGNEIVLTRYRLERTTLTFRQSFVALLRKERNDAEKLIVGALTDVLRPTISKAKVGEEHSTMPPSIPQSARLLHLMTRGNLEDHVHTLPVSESRLISEASRNFATSLALLDAHGFRGTEVTGAAECTRFLNLVVDAALEQTLVLLRRLDRRAVVLSLLEIGEANQNQQDRLRRTARASLALQKMLDPASSWAQEQQSQLARVATASRSLLEVAVCECQPANGLPPSDVEIDLMLAFMDFVFSAGNLSDSIRGGGSEARIKVHPNGMISAGESPLAAEYLDTAGRQTLEDQAASYSDYLEPNPRSKDADPDNDFDAALRSEYGADLATLGKCFGALIDIPMAKGISQVMVPRATLLSLLQETGGLAVEAADRLLRCFTLDLRSDWKTPPPPFTTKDIHPWRFQRRLSSTARPLVRLEPLDDADYCFGARALMYSFFWLMTGAREGFLDPEFFTSREMRKFAARARERRAEDFNMRTAAKLCEEGLNARPAVSMRSLGADKELGDVDVLVVEGERIIVIECKDLRRPLTTGDIVRQLHEYKGRPNDKIERHVRRVTWIRENATLVAPKVGVAAARMCVHGMVVTSSVTPIGFQSGLPTAVGPVVAFSDLLRALRHLLS